MATLDQLDAWGTLEQLDAYGTLEQLDSLVMHEASGTGTIALTESGGVRLLNGMSASDTIAITTSGTANFLVNIAGTADIAITEVGGLTLFKGFSASDTIALTQSSAFIMIRIPAFNPTRLVMTSSMGTTIIKPMGSVIDIAMTTLGVLEKLGETWSDVSGRTVTWSIN
jgi:hypothetical protein|tara:strand:- start:691 stop:1197 length:507 start_codon:yes stop_codon:yes gene_type:complete